jgi:SAM-dependent methyltransferase
MPKIGSLPRQEERLRKHFPDYEFSWEILTEIIVNQVSHRPRWLDLGAGANTWIREQPGARLAVGLDIARPDELILGPNESYCIADGENLPFKNGAFDLVTSRFVFEHLNAPETVLREVERVLRPGGMFVLQTTNKWNPLLAISRRIPYNLKKRILTALFSDIPSGIHKTLYRFNTPTRLRAPAGDLRLEQLIMLDDVLIGNPVLFEVSFGLLRLLDRLGLEYLKGNMIGIYTRC